MIHESVAPIWRQKFYQFLAFGFGEARAYADVLQRARIVKEAEQERSDRGAVASFVPSKAGHDAIAVALMLDLEHHALVGLIGAGNRLSDHTVEARAFKAPEPIRRDTWFTRCRSQMDWRHRACQQRLQLFAPPLERFAPPIAVSIAQQVEKEIDAGLCRESSLTREAAG